MGRHRSFVTLLLLLPQYNFGHGFVIDLGLSSSSRSSSSLTAASSRPLVVGPDPATKPDYDNVCGPLGAAVDQVFLRLFHASLYEQVRGVPYLDGSPPTFDDIAALAGEMNQTEPPAVVQQKALATLRSLFPSWLPRQYQILFSRPFPAFAARMNAWATYVAGTWLMGECRVVAVEEVAVDDGSSSAALITRPQQGLHVTRCRFLESAHCASVCVNACKIPTQTFFRDDMGIDLLMEPNYETYECTFSFGTKPTIATELAALQTPCLAACPAVSRQRHPTMALTTMVETGLCDMVAADDETNGEGGINADVHAA
jgi:hypothetical protein